MPYGLPFRYRSCRAPPRKVVPDGAPHIPVPLPDVESIMADRHVHREILDRLRQRWPHPTDLRVLLGIGVLSLSTVLALSSHDYDVADESLQPQPPLLRELEPAEFRGPAAPDDGAASQTLRHAHATALIRQPRPTPDGPLLPPPVTSAGAEQTGIIRVGFEAVEAAPPPPSDTVWLTGEIETMDE